MAQNPTTPAAPEVAPSGVSPDGSATLTPHDLDVTLAALGDAIEWAQDCKLPTRADRYRALASKLGGAR